jgi:hypothetical protein
MFFQFFLERIHIFCLFAKSYSQYETLASEGAGVASSDDWRESLSLCLLCDISIFTKNQNTNTHPPQHPLAFQLQSADTHTGPDIDQLGTSS